jgi:hypothetical protein
MSAITEILNEFGQRLTAHLWPMSIEAALFTAHSQPPSQTSPALAQPWTRAAVRPSMAARAP